MQLPLCLRETRDVRGAWGVACSMARDLHPNAWTTGSRIDGPRGVHRLLEYQHRRGDQTSPRAKDVTSDKDTRAQGGQTQAPGS